MSISCKEDNCIKITPVPLSTTSGTPGSIAILRERWIEVVDRLGCTVRSCLEDFVSASGQDLLSAPSLFY
jgi:hypothetical protein